MSRHLFLVFVSLMVCAALPCRGEVVYRWGEPVAGFRVGVHVPEGPFQPMEPVVIRVALRNDSSESVRVPRVPLFAGFELGVRDADGEAVEPTRYGVRRRESDQEGGVMTVTLAPGEFVEYRDVVINRLFDLSMAGEYRISVSIRRTDENAPREGVAEREVIIVEGRAGGGGGEGSGVERHLIRAKIMGRRSIPCG